MRVGAFELNEPLPELEQPHALAMLSPWVDVGSVGTLALSRLEGYFGAALLGRLARPGCFFDFTRYRPTLFLSEGRREVSVPNVTVSYARRKKGNDFLFLRLLEPHMLGEAYVDSVLRLLVRFGARRYCLLGSMYDMVPHTKPLLVSGGAVGEKAEEDLKAAGVMASDYQGPTTIAFLISRRAPELGIEAMSIIVHLPQYAQMEEDYVGYVRLMEVLGSVYGIPQNRGDVERAEQQRKRVSAEVEKDSRLKAIVEHLESHYESRFRAAEREEQPRLSPEIERFLREMDKRFEGH